MKNKLKILHLEDLPTDAELVERELKKGKINFELLVVDNKTTFERALKDFSPDIILSDHSLSSFDSIEALRLVKQAGGTVPFILVTATMTDEFAVNILNEGASDYIIKDRLHRLPSAVINAMDKWRIEDERKHAEETSLRLAAIVESSRDAIIGLSLDGSVTNWNHAAEILYGYSSEEVVGKPYAVLLHSDNIDEFDKKVERLKAGEELGLFESEHVRKNGKHIYASLSISLVKDATGKLTGISTNGHDISEQKRVQTVMNQITSDEKQRWIKMVNLELVGSLILGLLVLFFSYSFALPKKFFNAIGDLHNSIFDDVLFLVAFLFIVGIVFGFRRFREGYKGWTIQNTMKTVTAELEIQVQERTNDLSKSNETLLGEIIERKKTQQNLQRSESKLKEAQAIARLGNWEIDFIENKQTWSDALYDIYGINKDGAQPSTELFLSFMHPDDAGFAQKEVQKVFETSKPSSFNFRFIRKDGAVRHGYSVAQFEFGKNDKPVRLYGIVQDITERKIAEEKLEQQNKELLKTNSELDRFVYSASHDLRAPLSSMLGVIEISQDDTTDEQTLENLKMLKGSVKKLDEFIVEILDYSHNSRLEVKKEEINFKELLDTITQNLKHMGGNNRMVDIKIDVDNKVCIHSDKSRLSVILNNLISNAISYQNMEIPNPFVAVKIERSGTETGISISDNGIGIKKELHQKIFDMFYRVSDKSIGSGLGLYIVKETVGKLNGSIDVQSEPGKGSTFIIKIPDLN